jgi:hypothetical protein
MSIADNLHRVQERIASAAASAGRRAEEITLVGVTKYVDTNCAIELAAAGCHDLGESRPQALWAKYSGFNPPWSLSVVHRSGVNVPVASLTPPKVRWHLIGHLQRNKVARTLPLVMLIHSVDSERLLAAINDSAANLPLPPGEGRGEGDSNDSRRVSVLLEVNTSSESAKTGIAPADVESLLAAAPNYPHVAIRGLMTMAAFEGGPEVAARNFASLRELRDQLGSIAPSCVQLEELSMGMSDDFEVAIKEGATIVRVGSALWEGII